MTVGNPQPLSFRPERSGVEKSHSAMGQGLLWWEILGLRVSIEPKTFTLIPACRPARNDSSRDAVPAPFCFFQRCLYIARRPCHFDRSRSAANRKALLNFSFPLEGNAAKRQRVYEGKHTSNTLLLIYAGPTSADLETLCRVSTEWKNPTPEWYSPWRQEISRLRVSIEYKTFTLILACRPARNDSRGGSTCAILFLPQMPAHRPPPLSFRPERSGVEKSHSEMGQAALWREISGLRVSIGNKTFTANTAAQPRST